MYNSICPGKEWLDTNGKPIHAHGFSVKYDEKSGLYYWYGENKEHTKKGSAIWHWGVRLYTSKDLYNWEDKGVFIPPDTENLKSPIHPTYCMDRPHILYCKKTDKYVAWLKIMAANEKENQYMVIMTADKLEGPYTMVNEQYFPLGMDAGDFDLVYDEKQDKAYIIFERPHFELICATLTDDFTAANGEYSTHFPDRFPPFTREAPTFFERNGKKYLFTSGTTGYFPNPTITCTFDDFHGEYTEIGEPCVDDIHKISFNAQFTSVIKVHGTDLYIACADRWVPQDDVYKASEETAEMLKKAYANYVPDRSPRTHIELPGKERVHNDDTQNSRYVWLPIQWDGDRPFIRWYDEWKIEDFI